MDTRPLNGRTQVPEIGLGCWQSGGGWRADWDDSCAQQIFAAAYAQGVRFFDTANVYGDGASESSLGRFRRAHPDVFIASKVGRGPIYPDGYSYDAIRADIEASMQRLGLDCLDLVQLHCIPLAVLQQGDVFDWLRRLRDEGLIARFGASVESIEEGLLCLQQPDLCSLQVIFNLFRQRLATELLPQAQQSGVGIIVRLPLASGLLSGKLTQTTSFDPGDHRSFNRDGQLFNVGETFAGLPYEVGVSLADELRGMLPQSASMAQWAIRWVLDHPAVSVVIAGASRVEQAMANAEAATLPPLGDALHERLVQWYQDRVAQHIRGPY